MDDNQYNQADEELREAAMQEWKEECRESIKKNDDRSEKQHREWRMSVDSFSKHEKIVRWYLFFITMILLLQLIRSFL